MSLPSDRPIFLERSAYRRRRLGDAAKLFPVVTLCALLVPVWLAPAALSGAGGVIWIFSLWLTVVIASALLHRRLARKPKPADPDA
ncbi:hypothetical protein SAMN05421538_101286 [Paracoccus isoporae]|uniref:Uncharacterized protein n=1 Tax=Paracoccus isoporae TaxID=591205 RepID=A0A1G6TJA3_9RHOB|nr:hypothetical protein [Paracoccus isoporae]SDD28596.1 hypothetical protein SAMN05421538_101286 [Paracoccus isoporae]